MAIKTLTNLRHQRSLYRKSLMDTLRAWVIDYSKDLPRPCFLEFATPLGKTNGNEVTWAFQGIFVVNDKLSYPLYIGGDGDNEGRAEVLGETMEEQTLENLYDFIVQLACNHIKPRTIAELVSDYPLVTDVDALNYYINNE